MKRSRVEENPKRVGRDGRIGFRVLGRRATQLSNLSNLLSNLRFLQVLSNQYLFQPFQPCQPSCSARQRDGRVLFFLSFFIGWKGRKGWKALRNIEVFEPTFPTPLHGRVDGMESSALPRLLRARPKAGSSAITAPSAGSTSQSTSQCGGQLPQPVDQAPGSCFKGHAWKTCALGLGLGPGDRANILKRRALKLFAAADAPCFEPDQAAGGFVSSGGRPNCVLGLTKFSGFWNFSLEPARG